MHKFFETTFIKKKKNPINILTDIFVRVPLLLMYPDNSLYFISHRVLLCRALLLLFFKEIKSSGQYTRTSMSNFPIHY